MLEEEDLEGDINGRERKAGNLGKELEEQFPAAEVDFLKEKKSHGAFSNLGIWKINRSSAKTTLFLL